VCVSLKSSDVGHVEKLKADLSAEAPLHFVRADWPAGPRAGITLSSRNLAESLMRLGVTPRKSLTATPWSGPAPLLRHYWRGVFDGDGCIGKVTEPWAKWYLTLVGSEACMEGFRAWAAPISGSAARVRPRGKIWGWTAAGMASPQAVARALYEDSTVHLDRKYDLACQLMAAPILRRRVLVPASPD